MGDFSDTSPASRNARDRDEVGRHVTLEPKHKIFLSHSGVQKSFVNRLCEDLERCHRYPFFDIREYSLPIGENFINHIFVAIQQCYVGVVILSEEFLTSKWPMMELVAMVKEVKKRESTFKLVPVFLHITPAQFRDGDNRTRWRSCWIELAMKYPERVILKEWEKALKYLPVQNGLVCNEGTHESTFLKEIVDAICFIVPPEIRWEDSHVQGKSRLCKVIRDKIDVEQKCTIDGVCIVGLYGVGGMGKTTICKALCNEYFTVFRGRVCHAELERMPQEELLRDVLKRLGSTSHITLNQLNLSQLWNGLKEKKFIKEAVFLALDNLSDTSIMEAKGYLSAPLPPGSILLVTARSKESLARLRPNMVCMKMPELEVEEAKSLFVKSSEEMNKDDEELILLCVDRCRFQRDGSKESYHYHPLALDVLGRELSQFTDPQEWRAQLDMIDKDIFNLSKEREHPIFSILRKSFDSLCDQDRLLFMDIALFIPERNGLCNEHEWLAMVHGFPRVDDVKEGLKRLLRKSLLEFSENEGRRRFCLHDLWYAFCVEETKSGEIRERQWVYKESRTNCELVETSPSGKCWEKVKRMAFLDTRTLRSLERTVFEHFSNVTVLMISTSALEAKVVVDLSGLVHLKSLDISGFCSNLMIVHGLSRDLQYLSRVAYFSESNSQGLVNEIGGLSVLHYLRVTDTGISRLPDMRNMASLRSAIFQQCEKVFTVTGLSSKLTNLQVLNFRQCGRLNSCPGVGDLVNLEELDCCNCQELTTLPDLGKLRKLRKLDISYCRLITELPGLGALVALVELKASHCRKLSQLPDITKLKNLQILDLDQCESLTEVPGFDGLLSLQVVTGSFTQIVHSPNLSRLTNLKKVDAFGWSAAAIHGLGNMVMLEKLVIAKCSGVDELPDFGSLLNLWTLTLIDCEFTDISSLSNFSTLQTLQLLNCKMLKRVPDLQRHTKLDMLVIKHCGVSDLTSIGVLPQLIWLDIDSLPVRELPDLSNFPQLKSLCLQDCEGITALSISGPLTALTNLEVFSSGLTTLPDMGSLFPALDDLTIAGCNELIALNSSVPLMAMLDLKIVACRRFVSVPNLFTYFPRLLEIKLLECHMITELSSSGPLTALETLNVRSCSSLTALPDLGLFPALQKLDIDGCVGLMELSSTGALTTLTTLNDGSCSTLTGPPLLDLRMFPALRERNICDSSGLWMVSRQLSRKNASNSPTNAVVKRDGSPCWFTDPTSCSHIQSVPRAPPKPPARFNGRFTQLDRTGILIRRTGHRSRASLSIKGHRQALTVVDLMESRSPTMPPLLPSPEGTTVSGSTTRSFAPGSFSLSLFPFLFSLLRLIFSYRLFSSVSFLLFQITRFLLVSFPFRLIFLPIFLLLLSSWLLLVYFSFRSFQRQALTLHGISMRLGILMEQRSS